MRCIFKYNAIIDFISNKCKEQDDEKKRLFDKHRLLKKDKQIKCITEKLIKYDWLTSPLRCLLVLDDFANHPLLRSKVAEMCSFRFIAKIDEEGRFQIWSNKSFRIDRLTYNLQLISGSYNSSFLIYSDFGQSKFYFIRAESIGFTISTLVLHLISMLKYKIIETKMS